MSLALALLAVAAPAASAQAEIPLFSSISSPDWKADGDRGLWIRGNTRQWYYAEFASPCPRLQTAQALGFRTGPLDQFDKFSQVIAGGFVCPVISLVKSDIPIKRARKG